MPRIVPFLCALSLLSPALRAQPGPSAVARIVVTMGHYYGQNVPQLTADDLTVTEQFEPLPIKAVIPFKDDRARLELFILVDNCANCEGGPNAGELAAFVRSQPPGTSIGVAYIQDGALKIAQEPVADRGRALAALSPPAGGKPSNPFRALRALIEGWKSGAPRRAVLMITNGVDPAQEQYGQNGPAEEAITSAQKNQVTVFTIYHPSADYLSSDFEKIYSGQVQIAHVARETGGEGYFITYGPLPSLGPFLVDIADHLANQYLVEFAAPANRGAGELREVQVKSNKKDIDVMAPDRAWIPGSTGSR